MQVPITKHPVKTRRIVPLITSRNVMLALLSMQMISLVIFMYVWNARISTKSELVLEEDRRDSFYVKQYRLSNDILELNGYYTQPGGNSNRSNNSLRHENMLRLWGNETLLRQMKHAVNQNEGLERTSLPFEKFFNVSRQAKGISCRKLFEREKPEHERAKKIMENVQQPQDKISPEEYISITSNCSKFINDRGYIIKPLTKEEEEFPIAFSIIMYKDVWQVERLLRAIYRPQNLICIHVDSKTKDVIFKAVSGISHCFDNVFIASERINVQWGTFTELEPDIICMKDLWNKSKTWKYFINLTGQEFPLRTNYELVKILKIYNGTNAIESTYKRVNKERWGFVGPPPYGVRLIKGACHIAVTHAFVGYIVNDHRAAVLLNWTRPTGFPDEHYYQILNFNPSLKVPGNYKGVPETKSANRFKNWGSWPCEGKIVRSICIFAIGDLPLLAHRKELFANKFHQDYQRFALDCMEELHFNRTLDQYFGKGVVDFRWYSTLDHVKNKQKSV